MHNEPDNEYSLKDDEPA
jgi:protein AATF/BFR2